MKKINTIITLTTMVLSLNGFTGEGAAGVNLDALLKKQKEAKLQSCIDKAKDLNSQVSREKISSFEENISQITSFIRNNFEYNLLTFKPIPCLDPQIIVKEKESTSGEKPVQMPTYEIGQKADEEQEQKELKYTMLDQCLSISKRMKACDVFKKIKEEELIKINSVREENMNKIQAEDISRSTIEDSSPSIQESLDIHSGEATFLQ